MDSEKHVELLRIPECDPFMQAIEANNAMLSLILKYNAVYSPEARRARREERVFDREEVLGRDAKSVFPTESKAEVLNAAKEMLGSTNRFITESEVGPPPSRCITQHATFTTLPKNAYT